MKKTKKKIFFKWAVLYIKEEGGYIYAYRCKTKREVERLYKTEEKEFEPIGIARIIKWEKKRRPR